jgi:ubiquinone/menaquinone biosynthesis C-methylase UbiE
LSQVGELHGVDIDPDVCANSALRTANKIENDHFPFSDHSFDACVSNYVLEHVEFPGAHLAEVKRVLKPGGKYLFRTPNRYHYVAIVSNYSPLWFHRLIANRVRNLPRNAHDPYPTYYRFNDQRTVTAAAQTMGMEIVEFHLVEKEPSYGMSSRLMFLLFMGYERTVNCSEKLRTFRSNIFAVLKTPPSQAEGGQIHNAELHVG